jgi:hypothetical protein
MICPKEVSSMDKLLEATFQKIKMTSCGKSGLEYSKPCYVVSGLAIACVLTCIYLLS